MPVEKRSLSRLKVFAFCRAASRGISPSSVTTVAMMMIPPNSTGQRYGFSSAFEWWGGRVLCFLLKATFTRATIATSAPPATLRLPLSPPEDCAFSPHENQATPPVETSYATSTG